MATLVVVLEPLELLDLVLWAGASTVTLAVAVTVGSVTMANTGA
jgi:hypothetical protein